MPAPTVLLLVQLQEEKDPHHWGVDTGALHHAMNECGIDFIRTQVRPCVVSDLADHKQVTILHEVHNSQQCQQYLEI